MGILLKLVYTLLFHYINFIEFPNQNKVDPMRAKKASPMFSQIIAHGNKEVGSARLRERVIYTLSVRRPQPYNTNL